MVRTIVGASLVVFTSCAFGQPSFDVASIKPAKPPSDGRMFVQMSNDPGREDYTNVSLQGMITRAYGVKDYQVTGPDWINSIRFDVTATHPPNAPREQIQLMLQALLADRFRLTIHRKKKDLPAYALVVAKNGPKLKESKEGDAPPPPLPPPPASMSGAGGGVSVNRQVIAGRGGGTFMFGGGHLAATKQTMSAFADMLARQTDRPVIDETGLKGAYDFALDYAPEGGARGPMPFATAGGGDGRGPVASAPDDAPSLFAALQQQLGLKLEPKKLPLEMIVIDHIEKVATEN